MRVVVAVNRVQELGPEQTTSMLIASLVRAGHQVFVADIQAFVLGGDAQGAKVAATAHALPHDIGDSDSVAAWAASPSPESWFFLKKGDLILIRTNPGRDLARAVQHDSLLDLCRVAQQWGIHVVNDPGRLRWLASKAALALLPPHCRPAMWVSHRVDSIVDFIRGSGRQCVVKPLVGSRGVDVICVASDERDLTKRLSKLFAGRAMIAQEFVSSPRRGDQRIVVCGGKILEYDGHLGGIARIAAEGDFRGNLHAGGTAESASLDDRQRSTVETAAALLADQGIWLAGVDLVGDQVIEFNVFSPGGLYFASRFAKHSFTDQLVAMLPAWLARQV